MSDVATALFNAVGTIDPEGTFVYKYRVPLDSPRRLDWFFYVDDQPQGSGARVEFWCEALWALEEDGGARTDVVHPRRHFTAGQLHSDFQCIYNIPGRADVRFCWVNTSRTPQRLRFTVRGTRLTSPLQAGALSRASLVMTKEEERSQMETRIVQEINTALAGVHGMIVDMAPEFNEEDMRAVLFTDFETTEGSPGHVTPERWGMLHALASCALSQRGSAEEFRVRRANLQKLVCGTQGWRYFVHQKLEEACGPDDDKWFDSAPKLAAKRPEATSELRMSMARSSMAASLSDSSSVAPARHSLMKPVAVLARASHRLASFAEAHPPESVCQKMKPKLRKYVERRIKIDGVSLYVYDKDETGAWDAKPRGSSIVDLRPNFMTEQKCTVVRTETTLLLRSRPWSGPKKTIVVYTPLDGEVAFANGATVKEKDLRPHCTDNGGGGRFAFHDETEFNKFWQPLLNLSEGRPWNCSQAQALRDKLTTTKVDWWSVEDVEEWIALLGLRRWPQDETFCAQQAVRSYSIDGATLLTLAALPDELVLQTLSEQLKQTSAAKGIDTARLAEVLLHEKIRPLAQDQLQPEPEPMSVAHMWEASPESEIPEAIAPHSTHGADLEPLSPRPAPLQEPEPEPEPEDGTPFVEPEPQPVESPEEVEAQLQLVLSQTPSWIVERFGQPELLPVKTTEFVQHKYEEHKRARGERDDRLVGEARGSLSHGTTPANLPNLPEEYKRTAEITVDLNGGRGVINFMRMQIRMLSGADKTLCFPIKFSRREPSEVVDAQNFVDRREVLAELCTSESEYVAVLSSLRESCFAPVAEKVADKQHSCGPFPQCDAFADLLSLHTDFAVQLRDLPSPLPMKAEVQVLHMLAGHFKRMPQIWANYLQYESKDILQMLSIAQIRRNDSQLMDLHQKSTQRVVQLFWLIKKMSQMAPPDQLHSVQELLNSVMETCRAHPSITAQQQLHLPLSSSMTGTAVPNCCLWLLPAGFSQHIGHETWTAGQSRGLGGLRHKYWEYGNKEEVRTRVSETKQFIATHKEHVLCLILFQDVCKQRQSTASDVDEHAGTLPRTYSGLDNNCAVFSQHNLDDFVVFGDDPTAEDSQDALKNVLTDRIREKHAEALDKQALTILARGKTELEHVFELQDRVGNKWVASRAVVMKQGLLKYMGDSGAQSSLSLQAQMVSLSANELKWSDDRVDTAHITQVNCRLAWDKDLNEHGFEVSTKVAQVTTVHKFLAEKMLDRDAWVASIEKVLQASADQHQPLRAFCRADFVFRDSPEELLLPVEKDAQWVFVGEWAKDPWEYSHDSLQWEAPAGRSSHIYRRRKWWCFKQLLPAGSFNKINPQNRDWSYVRRLEAVEDRLTELVSTEEPLHGQAFVDFSRATEKSLRSVLSVDDDRGYYEIATWFARTLTIALEKDFLQNSKSPGNGKKTFCRTAKVLAMVNVVVELYRTSQRFGKPDTVLYQLSSLLRCEVDPMISERIICREASFLESVLGTAQECRRVFRIANIDPPEARHCDENNLLRVHELLANLARDPHRWELSQKETNFLWAHRDAEFLHQDGRMLSKVLLAVPDWDLNGPEAVALLKKWKKPLTPLQAIALLDDRFWWAAKTRFVTSSNSEHFDGESTNHEAPKVCTDAISRFRPFRSYAVECLGGQDGVGWTDEDFCRYMLQMAVVLRTQMHSFDLVQLLLQRALRSPETVGHAFYWHVRAEMCRALADAKFNEAREVADALQIIPSDTPSEVFVRLAIILRTYLNLCPSDSREALRAQEEHLVQPLKDIAKTIVARSKNGESLDDLTTWMRDELPKMVAIQGDLALPVAAKTRVTSVLPQDCSILKSATKALWLKFCVVGGEEVSVIFKDGDDLRQDELVLQAFELMQGLWTKAPSFAAALSPLLQDESLSIYRVSDLGGEVGMITPVTDSFTLAKIFIEQFGIEGGGWQDKPSQVKQIVDSVLGKPEVLYEWIQANRGDVSEEDARKNFMHSCAGYCVATFILGLGDRHSSNIMLQKDGHLVHIDFGWWLGHNPQRPPILKLLLAIFNKSAEYDDDGFAFVPSFAYIIVGPDVWDDQGRWRQSARFAEFTQLCCECYAVIRNNAHDLINVFSVMLAADIGEEVEEKHGGGTMKLDAAALKALRDKFKLDVEDAVAADWFKEKIDAALSDNTAEALLINWVLNTLGQMG